jgi:hypothetical protein
MSIEEVRCKKCGSRDVRPTSPDSYTCEHCHASFRRRDPKRKTVVQVRKPDLCECGRIAKRYCHRCKGNGICGNPYCDTSLFIGIGGFQDQGGDFRDFVIGLLDVFGPELRPRAAELLRQAEMSFGMPSSYGYICEECQDGFQRALDTALDALTRDAVEKGALCRGCFLSKEPLVVRVPSEGRCAVCGDGICSTHGTRCEQCHQRLCKSHISTGTICSRCEKQKAERDERFWENCGRTQQEMPQRFSSNAQVARWVRKLRQWLPW